MGRNSPSNKLRSLDQTETGGDCQSGSDPRLFDGQPDEMLRDKNCGRIAPGAGTIRTDRANARPMIFAARQSGDPDPASAREGAAIRPQFFLAAKLRSMWITA